MDTMECLRLVVTDYYIRVPRWVLPALSFICRLFVRRVMATLVSTLLVNLLTFLEAKNIIKRVHFSERERKIKAKQYRTGNWGLKLTYTISNAPDRNTSYWRHRETYLLNNKYPEYWRMMNSSYNHRPEVMDNQEN